MAVQQVGAEKANYWMAFPLSSDTGSSPKPKGGDGMGSSDGAPVKVRKPYTITKQRERWTEDEHQKFLDALKLHGRAWRRIEEHIGTKTAVQIRSHAQKFFSKLEREASLGGSLVTTGSGEIEIPPPRPKRKPSHPYPKKALGALSNSPSFEEDSKSPPAIHSAFTPLENSSGSTKANSPPKKDGSSATSLRLFGQTMVQGINKVEANNELMESTGSPRSQVSVGTEETSGTSPLVSNVTSNSCDRSALVSKLKEPTTLEFKSQLFNTLSEREKSLIAAHSPHFLEGHHTMQTIPAFWQGFMPRSFANGTNDDANAAAAIAAATYAVASAWQAIQGAVISNASNESNTSIVYSPTAVLAATGKPISVPMPLFPPQEQLKMELGGPYHDCGSDSDEGTLLNFEESSNECCSSLTDSSLLSSHDSNEERVPAKKRQRHFLGDSVPLHNKPVDALHSTKCERFLKLDTIPAHIEDPGNVQRRTVNSAIHLRSTNGCVNGLSEIDSVGQSLSDELMQPVEDSTQDTEQPLNLIIEACGLNLMTETEGGSFKGRGVLKENHDTDKDIVSSSQENTCISKGGVRNTELRDMSGLQFSVNSTHIVSGEHLFLFKAGASSSRYSGVGFVPYKKSTTVDPLSNHEE
ncbi:hypothetical protein L7F22_011358 [Adiantum nelumboides]|nr:hypothetical protein [Adiantum nelumboides]